MGLPVLVLGQSGSGKTFSIRNLLDKDTLLINVVRKPLPFRVKTKFKTKETDSYAEILMAIKTHKGDKIIIDDSQYLMANEFMRRSKERGFDKFTDIGFNFWEIINQVIKLSSKKRVYFLHHTEFDSDTRVEKAKTIGKLLDEKITLEGMFSIVLKSVRKDKKWYFQTQSNGLDTVKSPYEMFDSEFIENDLAKVDEAIIAYYSTDELEGTEEGSDWSDGIPESEDHNEVDVVEDKKPKKLAKDRLKSKKVKVEQTEENEPEAEVNEVESDNNQEDPVEEVIEKPTKTTNTLTKAQERLRAIQEKRKNRNSETKDEVEEPSEKPNVAKIVKPNADKVSDDKPIELSKKDKLRAAKEALALKRKGE